MGKRVEKTRNSNTMSESAFWGWLRSALRQKSRFWKPIQECKKKARRAYSGANKRQKFEYQCAHCHNWFSDKEVEVDHIVEAGSLTCGKDMEGFIERLFCEISGLQVLCKICHLKKTGEKRNAKKSLEKSK